MRSAGPIQQRVWPNMLYRRDVQQAACTRHDLRNTEAVFVEVQRARMPLHGSGGRTRGPEPVPVGECARVGQL